MSNGRATSIAYTPLAQDWPICVCWWCGFFYEASSWEYSFYVPHDVKALVEKCGGNIAFQRRLDTLFVKGYYNVGNEPSFLTPNLYHWIGRPDLSNDRIHAIIEKYYTDKTDGIPGNDDSGAMSSWLAFHMMGLYPNAGQPYYLLNAPYFNRIVLHLANGKDLLIKANLSDKNKYIKSVKLDGQKLDRSWIDHNEIMNGGELEFEMSSIRSQEWGTKNLPPSKSDNN
jgi:putative alpha-1,2-mannosidase